MEKRKEGTSEEEKWVHDASVDYKGRLPFRASTGVWKASLFVLSKKFTRVFMHQTIKQCFLVNFYLCFKNV